MKRLLNIVGTLLGLLALGAMAVALALTFGGLRTDTEPPSQAFQSPIEPPAPISPPPRATPTPPGATSTPIPRCTFGSGLAPEVSSGPSLDAYVFSEPRVALTNAPALGIVDWLPDSQRLLITRGISGTNRQTIETVDIRTGETRVYAKRRSAGQKPVWATTLDGIAYTTVVDGQVELRFSQGDPELTQWQADGLASTFLATDPSGQWLLYLLDGKRPQLLNLTTKATQSVGVDLSQWEYSTPLQQAPPTIYQMAWRPGTSQVAFHNNVYFFLVDVESGQSCEVDLGWEGGVPSWAVVARWSPDGRYLAMLTTTGVPPVGFVDLSILDTATGELRSMHPEVYINPGQYYVTEIAWAPNSHVVAILAAVEEKEGALYRGLYLVEVATGRNRRMLPQTRIVFPGGNAGWNLAWSPDGSYLAVTCLYDPLCLIEVIEQ